MTGIYGHKWASSYGEEVSETWVRGLADLSGAELAQGLRGCLERSEATIRSGETDWPPTLGEFRIIARPSKPAEHEIFVSLPKPQISKEEALEWVNKIRAELKV